MSASSQKNAINAIPAMVFCWLRYQLLINTVVLCARLFSSGAIPDLSTPFCRDESQRRSSVNDGTSSNDEACFSLGDAAFVRKAAAAR